MISRRIRRVLAKTTPRRFMTAEGFLSKRDKDKITLLNKVIVESMGERRLRSQTRLETRQPLNNQLLRLPLLSLYAKDFKVKPFADFDKDIVEALIAKAEKRGYLDEINRFACRENVYSAVINMITDAVPAINKTDFLYHSKNQLIWVENELFEEKVAYIGWAMGTEWWSSIASLSHAMDDIMRCAFFFEVDQMKDWYEEAKIELDKNEMNEIALEYWNDPKIMAYISDGLSVSFEKVAKKIMSKEKDPQVLEWYKKALELVEKLHTIDCEGFSYIEKQGLFDESTYPQSFFHRIYLGQNDNILIEQDRSNVNEIASNYIPFSGYVEIKFSMENKNLKSSVTNNKYHEKLANELREQFIRLVDEAELIYTNKNGSPISS